LEHLQQSLCASGYHEAINYSFVDRRRLKAFHQDSHALALANPLSAEMDVMRTTLLPGLLASLKYNLRRQQVRVRLFETGLAFLQYDTLQEIPRIAGVATGPAWPEQWSQPVRAVDFFDVKGDVESLLALGGHDSAEFEPLAEPWAHPGASARVSLNQHAIGWCGALHPDVLKALDVDGEVFAFELDLEPLQQREVLLAKPVSRLPSIRRDLSFWVPEAVSFAEIRSAVVDVTGNLLQNLVVFDVYQDNNLKKGYKSVAIGLILQHVSSTLTDEMVDPVVKRAITGLEERLGAYLRG
jgi:phenylalanyl-tRNA synthetase beta chain